jgi:hypothetical protein
VANDAKRKTLTKKTKKQAKAPKWLSGKASLNLLNPPIFFTQMIFHPGCLYLSSD